MATRALTAAREARDMFAVRVDRRWALEDEQRRYPAVVEWCEAVSRKLTQIWYDRPTRDPVFDIGSTDDPDILDVIHEMRRSGI